MGHNELRAKGFQTRCSPWVFQAHGSGWFIRPGKLKRLNLLLYPILNSLFRIVYPSGTNYSRKNPSLIALSVPDGLSIRGG